MEKVTGERVKREKAKKATTPLEWNERLTLYLLQKTYHMKEKRSHSYIFLHLVAEHLIYAESEAGRLRFVASTNVCTKLKVKN